MPPCVERGLKVVDHRIPTFCASYLLSLASEGFLVNRVSASPTRVEVAEYDTFIAYLLHMLEDLGGNAILDIRQRIGVDPVTMQVARQAVLQSMGMFLAARHRPVGAH